MITQIYTENKSIPIPHTKRQPLFFDVDDCAILSVESAIALLNYKYSLHKTPSDLRDWDFKSIYRDITPSELSSLFESDEFFALIKPNPGFLSILSSPSLKKYDCYFVTKGSPLNLQKKVKRLEELFGSLISNFTFIGIPPTSSKGLIDMSAGIVIDDNCQYLLETNAHIKILNQNMRATDYNNAFGNYNNQIDESVYYAQDMSEVKDLLEFNAKVKL